MVGFLGDTTIKEIWYVEKSFEILMKIGVWCNRICKIFDFEIQQWIQGKSSLRCSRNYSIIRRFKCGVSDIHKYEALVCFLWLKFNSSVYFYWKISKWNNIKPFLFHLECKVVCPDRLKIQIWKKKKREKIWHKTCLNTMEK